jgi:hypothetical protein
VLAANPYDIRDNPYAAPDASDQQSQIYDPYAARQYAQAPDLPGDVPATQAPPPPPPQAPQDDDPDRARQARAARQVFASRDLRRVAAEAMLLDPSLTPTRAKRLAEETLRRYPQLTGR